MENDRGRAAALRRVIADAVAADPGVSTGLGEGGRRARSEMGLQAPSMCATCTHSRVLLASLWLLHPAHTIRTIKLLNAEASLGGYGAVLTRPFVCLCSACALQ